MTSPRRATRSGPVTLGQGSGSAYCAGQRPVSVGVGRERARAHATSSGGGSRPRDAGVLLPGTVDGPVGRPGASRQPIGASHKRARGSLVPSAGRALKRDAGRDSPRRSSGRGVPRFWAVTYRRTHAFAHRELRIDRGSARVRARLAGRRHRLALHATLRLRGVHGRARRPGRARALDAVPGHARAPHLPALPAGDDDPGDGLRVRRREGAPRRLHAVRGTAATQRGPHRRGARGDRPGDADPQDAVRLRPVQAVDHRAERRHRAHDRSRQRRSCMGSGASGA